MEKGRFSISTISLRACLLFLLIISGATFFHSCEEPLTDCLTEIIIEGVIETKSRTSGKIKSLDIFIFSDNGVLDSYERINDAGSGHYYCRSKIGEKRIVVIANCPSDKLDYSETTTYRNLSSVVFELDEDSEEMPLMSAEADFIAGTEKGCVLKLRPLMCEMIISKVYSEKDIENVRLFLRNISTRARLLDTEDCIPTGIKEKSESIRYRAGMTFLCYPNSGEGGLGSPQTELVITWEENGEEKEYSETINDGIGIERGSKYYFSIKI